MAHTVVIDGNGAAAIITAGAQGPAGPGTDAIYSPFDIATTANITLSGEQVIDGQTTSASRVVVKDQSNTEENGGYLSGAGAWTRVADMDTAAEFDLGALVTVRLGSTNGGTSWQLTAVPTVLDTDAVTFGATGAAGSGDPDQNLWETFTADTGSAVANLTNDSFAINGTAPISTAISGDAVTISLDAAGVDTAQLTDNAVTLAKLAGGTAGELITFDASGDPAAVAVGTATHILTSNGAGSAPTFQAAVGGGSGSMTTVKNTGSAVGDADIVTLDFGAGLVASEAPDTEINITLDFSEVAGHDNFTDFVADEHIAHSGVDITAGSGLTGGGSIDATRTLNVGAGTAITVNANDVAVTAGGIDTTQLADDGVTYAKMQNVVADDRLLGNVAGAGGLVAELDAATVLTMINVEAGADVTDVTNVTAAGALMDSEVTNLAQVKAFDTTDYATAAQGSTADSALQPSDIASGSITPRADDIDFSGGSDGDVLTVQADGSIQPEALAGGGDALTANGLDQFAATTSAELAGVISDETGSGALVFATSPTLVTPALGTPASGVATNLTGTASGLTAGNVTNNANLTGHVTSTGNAAVLGSFTLAQLNTAISDGTVIEDVEGTAVLSTGEGGGSKFLREDGDGTSSWQAIPGGGDALTASPLSQFAATTSLQLKGVLSDETGSGAAVFATSPTLVTPALGTPASGVMTNVTGTAAGLTAGNVTNNANLTGHVTSTGNAAVLGSFTMAQLNTAISDSSIEAGADVTDTTNVTAAGALMDSEVTNLAQVKAFDTTDYATAAQGTTADSALQPADIASGTITARADDINFSGGSDGDVLTVQADGSLAVEALAGGGDALTSNGLDQFAATTSAELAGVISNETGSGALVFATSPTLVTPALGTPASGVATNLTGTAAGLTAGNVTTNANLTGHVTSVGNAAVLGSFTMAQLNAAISDSSVEALADVTDVTNVTAAGALMDSEVTNLAQVKAFDTTDYATAAQGSTADSALQPSDIASGSITARADDINFSGGSDGDVLTVQADGSLAVEALAGGGDALTSNGLDQFAATTSAELAGVMSDETGSGALVFATSPTLVTPALGTPASGVATNLTGTAAGLTAGNVTTNANLTGHITSTGNAAVLGSFTTAQLNTAISDGSIPTTAEIEDLAGGLFTGNTETGVTATYQVADNTLDLVVSDTTVAGDSGSTGITPGDTLTIAGGTNATTAMSGDTLTINVDAIPTTAEIEDLAGGLFTGNTETGITATYQVADNTLDLVVSDTTVAGDTGSTGMTPGDTLTVAGGTNATTAMSGDILTVNVDDAFLSNSGDVGTGVYDFGGATSLKIPNSADPTIGTDGVIGIDTSVADFSHGVLEYFSGELMSVVAMPVAEMTTPSAGAVPTYNATNDEFEMVVPSGSGDALVANPLSQFAATSSAQLATVINDETGTGLLVFATNPALTTPDLGTPSAAVLTNATGTAAGLTAGTVTTNANLTGHITSTGNAAILGSFTVAQLSAALSDASISGNNTGDEAASSTTVSGVIEVATAAEINTGTDAARAVSPDTLAASNLGIRYVQIRVFDVTTDTATGDKKATFHVPPGMDGMCLVYVHAEVDTAGTTSTVTNIQIHNIDNATNMLSTALTIDLTETGSDTAATPAVIDSAGGNDVINTNDVVRIDVDAVSSVAAKGLVVTMGFQLP